MSYYKFQNKNTRHFICVDKYDKEKYEKCLSKDYYNLVGEFEGNWNLERINLEFSYDADMDSDEDFVGKDYIPTIKRLADAIEYEGYTAEEFYDAITNEKSEYFYKDTFDYLQEELETDADGVNETLKDYTLEDWVKLFFASDLDEYYFECESPFTKEVIDAVWHSDYMRGLVAEYGW